MTALSSGGTVLKFEVYGDKIDLADEILEEFVPIAKKAVNDASELLLAEIERLLTLRSGTAKTAAPEGQPPEQDTSELVKSWRRIPARVRGNSVTGGVKSNDPKAIRLEYGLTDKLGRRILPHPFLRPAMANTRDAIGQLLQERLG